MFMRENRKKNGATQPGLAGPGAGNSAQKISANLPIGATPSDLRFTPDMSSPASINSGHYAGGISGDGPYKNTNVSDIPFVGNANESKIPLKG